MSDVGPDDAALRGEIATLRLQVAALADFVTTVTAALVTDRSLASGIVATLMVEKPPRSSRSDDWPLSEVTVATLAHNTLAIAGRVPMPPFVRLVHSADEPDASC